MRTARINDAVMNPKSWNLNGSDFWFQIMIKPSGESDENGQRDGIGISPSESSHPPVSSTGRKK